MNGLIYFNIAMIFILAIAGLIIPEIEPDSYVAAIFLANIILAANKK